jgi:DNA polymerase-3 subunit beta
MMKFTLKKSEIIKPMNIVRNIINAKSMKPILQNMLVEMDGEAMTIEGSDLEVGIRYRLGGIGTESPGKTTVPAEKFVKIISESPEEMIVVMVEDDKAYIASGSAKFEMSVIPADDYPEFPAAEEPAALTVPFEKLREMIGRTIIGTAVDAARYVFRGILFEYEGGLLNLVATDSHILAKATVKPQSASAEEGTRVVVPRKVLDEIQKIDYEGDVRISFDKQHIHFDLGHIVLVSRLIDAKYPKYDKVIPTVNNKKAVVPRIGLLDSLRRVSVFVNRESGRASLQFGKDKLKITSRMTDIGLAEDVIAVQYEDEDLRIDFNYKYIKDILSTLEDKNVFVTMYNNESAVLITPENTTDYLWVVMPLVMLD